ncbi:hypothetical protein IJ765_01035 [Candidatus Saccharibacteria bacterium]|nr:hypothetical protein [Candidatus Saccharibacteria bacterium]
MGRLQKTIAKNNHDGFTIAELSIAMAFIAVLLVTIAFLIIHLTSLYQKGLSLKAVNTAGQNITDHIARALTASPSEKVSTLCNYLTESSQRTSCAGSAKAGSKVLFQQTYVSDVRIKSSNTTISGRVPASGVLCTGNFSYLWNTGYVLDSSTYVSNFGANLSDSQATLNYNGTDYTGFHLLAVRDEKRQVCTSSLEQNGATYANPNHRHVITGGNSSPTELLSDNNEDTLAVYDFQLFTPSYHETSKHSFYSGNFILATVRGGININATGEFCTAPPDNLSSDYAYCAINKFEFATRATGEKVYVEQN